MDGYLCGLVPKEYRPSAPDKGCMPPKKGGR
jgi:phospholipid/cholesterol/gamma-HCH transport system substrate-binding protein